MNYSCNKVRNCNYQQAHYPVFFWWKGAEAAVHAWGACQGQETTLQASARVLAIRPGSMVSWRCSPRGWLERLGGPLCQQHYRRNERHLHWLSQTAVLLRQALVLCYIPAFKPWAFYLWLPKCQSFEGSGGNEQNASSFKDPNNKYRIPFSLTQELFFFKASRKTFRKHTRQQNKCAIKSCFSPLTVFSPKMGFSSSKPGSSGWGGAK